MTYAVLLSVLIYILNDVRRGNEALLNAASLSSCPKIHCAPQSEIIIYFTVRHRLQLVDIVNDIY